MNRREFVALAFATAWTPRLTLASTPKELVAQPVQAQILPQGEPSTPMLGFNGATPGPVLRVRQGQTVDVRFLNRTGQDSALHWHGLRSSNAMDGVPGLTQDVVGDGAEFRYSFGAPDAGTFWYHSHSRSWEQVARGFYGPLIVDEETPPDVDHDLVVMIDDWRLTEDGTLSDDFENRHDQAHFGRLGNYGLALVVPDLALQRGDRVRLRLINVATDRIFPLQVDGIDGKIVAVDGMPLPVPNELSEVVLSPAQRTDIIADVVSSDHVSVIFTLGDQEYVLGEIPVMGRNTARVPSAVDALPPNDTVQPDLDHAVSLTLLMEGGAMSPQMMTQSDLWAFNGQSGLSDTPLHRFERGQTGLIRMVNDTRFPHGIHLHGHHFFEIGDDGELGAFRDTTLVDAGETRDIACVFDNPGKWMLHCHMLGHQASGMKTWVDVT